MRKWVMFSSTTLNEDNRQHLDTTIWSGVNIEECYNEELITLEERDILNRIYPNGRFNCWGTHDGVTKLQFDKIEVGDFVLASSGEFADITGYVSYVLPRPNSELGYKLWQSRDWKWIFFIKDIREVSVPLDKVQSLIGYYDYTVQGLNVKEHNNVQFVIDYVEGRKTWDEVRNHRISADDAKRRLTLETTRTFTKRNGEVVTFTLDEIISGCRRSLRDNNINCNVNNVYNYLEGNIEGIEEHKKIYYGKGADMSKENFEKLYKKYKRAHNIN